MAEDEITDETGPITRSVLDLDAAAESARIEEALRAQVLGTLRRKGLVLGVSGGIDSSVSAALATRALGKERVVALLMPERDSSDDSMRLGKLLAAELGIATIVEDIAPILAAAGCYDRQHEAIRSVVPDFEPGWRYKLTLPSILESERFNITYLTVETPSGGERRVRLTLPAYLQIVAATNYKQRIRKMTEYYHADRLNYAVLGTPNRLEYDQGFFVKGGDGLADVKPLAHLYKTQVYALAEHLRVPEEIRKRPPTTETFSLPQGQDEFYFSLPHDKMDLCLWAHNHAASAERVAPALGITPDQVRRVYKDIEAKRRATRYLHASPLLVEPVKEVEKLA